MIKYVVLVFFGVISSFGYSQIENKVSSVSVVSKNSYLCNLSDCGDIQTLREFNSITQSNNIAPMNTIGVRYHGRVPSEKTIKQKYSRILEKLENDLRLNLQKIREIEEKISNKKKMIFQLLGAIDISIAELAGTKSAEIWHEIKILESKIISIQHKNLELITLTRNLQRTVIHYLTGISEEYDLLLLSREIVLEHSDDLILVVNSVIKNKDHQVQLEEVEYEILERFEVENLQERLSSFVSRVEANQTFLTNVFEKFNKIFKIYNDERFLYVVNTKVQQSEIIEEIFEIKNEIIKGIFEEAFDKAINDNIEKVLSHLQINSLFHLISLQQVFAVNKKKAALLLAGTLGVSAISVILFVKEITDAAELTGCQAYTENMMETNDLCVPEYKIGPKVLSFLGRSDKKIKNDFKHYPELKTYYRNLASVSMEKPSFKSLECSSNGGFNLQISPNSIFHEKSIKYNGSDTFIFGRLNRGMQVKTTQDYNVREIRIWEEEDDVPGMFILSDNILKKTNLRKKEQKKIEMINYSKIFLYEVLDCCRNKDNSCALNFKMHI